MEVRTKTKFHKYPKATFASVYIPMGLARGLGWKHMDELNIVIKSFFLDQTLLTGLFLFKLKDDQEEIGCPTKFYRFKTSVSVNIPFKLSKALTWKHEDTINIIKTNIQGRNGLLLFKPKEVVITLEEAKDLILWKEGRMSRDEFRVKWQTSPEKFFKSDIYNKVNPIQRI